MKTFSLMFLMFFFYQRSIMYAGFYRFVPFVNVDKKEAVVVIQQNGGSGISGTVRITQVNSASVSTIKISLKGLDANKEHGFHVHQYGDLSNGCTSAGGHYNPFDETHGSPQSQNRHVGDLGNITSNDQGEVEVEINDSQVTLYGEYSVLGRAIVVHAGQDDLGQGGDAESLKTGNAGSRIGCGVIGIAAISN